MPKSVFTDAYAAVVEYLIELRKAQGVSQVELAARLGKTQQFVSKVENRLRRLDVVEFFVIVEALGKDPRDAAAELLARLPADTRI